MHVSTKSLMRAALTLSSSWYRCILSRSSLDTLASMYVYPPPTNRLLSACLEREYEHQGNTSWTYSMIIWTLHSSQRAILIRSSSAGKADYAVVFFLVVEPWYAGSLILSRSACVFGMTLLCLFSRVSLAKGISNYPERLWNKRIGHI